VLRNLKLSFALCIFCLLAVVPAASAAITVSEPHPSIFSVNTNLYDNNWNLWNQGIPKAAAVGARWVEFTVDARAGTPNLSALDYQVNMAKKNGLGVLINFGGISNACSVSGITNIDTCPPRTAAELKTYGQFVANVIWHFRNTVDTYESWREPSTWWKPAPNPAQYAALLKTEYAVFQTYNRAFNMHLKLLFGGPINFCTLPANGYAVLPYVHKVLYYLQGARAFDAVAVHAYHYPHSASNPADRLWGPDQTEWDYVSGTVAGPNGESWRQLTWPQELTYYEQQFAHDGYPNMGVWITEFGWDGVANPTAATATFAPWGTGINDFPSLSTQAQWVGAAYHDLLQLPFVKAAFWFNLRDDEPGISIPDPPQWRVMGLLNYNYTAKPALAVWQGLNRANPSR
jgi:hypothetical protein